MKEFRNNKNYFQVSEEMSSKWTSFFSIVLTDDDKCKLMKTAGAMEFEK